MEQQWRKLNGQPITRPIEEEIKERIFLEQAAGHELKVCIGTDSQVKGAVTEFAFQAKPHAFASSSCANKMVQ